MRSPLVLLLLVPTLTGCGQSSPVVPSASRPVPAPAPAPQLAMFVDDLTGFQTSDLRDAQNQIIQFNSGNELIWTPDGTRLPGYHVWSHTIDQGRRSYFIQGKICETGCEFEVRFGIDNGEPRAYLTVDYGHDNTNPGPVSKVKASDRMWHVAQPDTYPPGTPPLSGTVTGGRRVARWHWKASRSGAASRRGGASVGPIAMGSTKYED